MTTATASKVLWWDGNSVVCPDHMGATLKAKLEKRKGGSCVTSFGVAYKMDEVEIADLEATFKRDLCTDCHYLATVGA
jgi:hypothetical protein